MQCLIPVSYTHLDVYKRQVCTHTFLRIIYRPQNKSFDKDALDFLADISNGDARAALTAVELGILTTERSGDGLIHLTLSVASECIQKRVVKYDKSGDNQDVYKRQILYRPRHLAMMKPQYQTAAVRMH